MGKREWGRRRVDDQPYPKTRDKDELPSGLTPVEGTRRKDRTLLTKGQSLGRVHDDFTVGTRYGPGYEDVQEFPLVFPSREGAQADIDTWFEEGYHEGDYTKDDLEIVRGMGYNDDEPEGDWHEGWIVAHKPIVAVGEDEPER